MSSCPRGHGLQGGDCLFYAEGFGVGSSVQEEAVPQFPSLQRAPPALRPSARRRRGVRAPGSAPHAWHLGGRRRHRHHDNPVPDCGGSEQTAPLPVLQMFPTPDEVRSQGIRLSRTSGRARRAESSHAEPAPHAWVSGAIAPHTASPGQDGDAAARSAAAAEWSPCPAVVKVTNRKSDRPRSGATCADDVPIDAHTGGEQAAAKPAVLGRGSLRVLLLWFFFAFFFP